MGRAKGNWDLWHGASEEHPRQRAVTSDATKPEVPIAERPKGCTPFCDWAALARQSKPVSGILLPRRLASRKNSLQRGLSEFPEVPVSRCIANGL